jgi:hypothetical protein
MHLKAVDLTFFYHNFSSLRKKGYSRGGGGIGMGVSLEEGQGSNPAIGFEGSSIPGVNRPILDNKI